MSREVVRWLTQIEFMLKTQLEFENGLWSQRDNFREKLLKFLSEKCELCKNQTKLVKQATAVDDIRLQIAIIVRYAEELKKLAGKMETLSSFFSEENPFASEHGCKRQSPTTESVGAARNINKRAKVSSAVSSKESRKVGNADSSLDALNQPVASVESIQSLTDLVTLLETAFVQSVENLGLRASELEVMCLELQRELKFEEMKDVLDTLKNLTCLESLTKTTFTERYKSATSSAGNMLASESRNFEALIRAEEMQRALQILDTVRTMLVLKDDLPQVEAEYLRLNSVFQEKTSKFKATMNELLEGKHFEKLARLLRGHGQLDGSQRDLDGAQQQLEEFFKIRFESGWSSIKCITPTKRIPDQKIYDLSLVIKDFKDARGLFEIFGEQNRFIEWDEMLIRKLLSKAKSIAEFAGTSIDNFDFQGHYDCSSYLEALQIILPVVDDIGQYLADMDEAMRQRINGLEAELIGAIERVEARTVDKILNGLKGGFQTGGETANVAGRKLNAEYERLQSVLESSLKDLCATIQRSLDAYEIREAHENLKKFRSLVVSQAVQGTEYNRGLLEKFSSEMDEIKKEILTPRLLTEDPEKICRCLQGFKDVDYRWASIAHAPFSLIFISIPCVYWSVT